MRDEKTGAGVFGALAYSSMILQLFKAKGWNLYKNISGEHPERIMMQGKADDVEVNNFYIIAPATFRHDDPAEVMSRMADAQQKKRHPVYDDRVNPPYPLGGIWVTRGGINFVDARESTGIELSNFSDVEAAIKLNISNYNIHYFDSIDDIASFVQENKITPQRPSAQPNQSRWIQVERDECSTQGALWPANPSPILFRGQTRRYEPCFPLISRNWKHGARKMSELDRIDQAGLVLNLIKVQWFVECLRKTPMMKWMKQHNLFMDETAVAQHYGMPTGYIDVTQSFEVASFFACCAFDQQTEKWEPVAEGEGVVYVIDYRETPMGCPIKPICLQPLPRPREQWAWTCELRMGEDFDTLPFVRKFIFKHNRGASERILGSFRRGRALFPPDTMAKVADGIECANVLPKPIATKTVRSLVADADGLPGMKMRDVLDLVAKEKRINFSKTSVEILDDAMIAEMDVSWDRTKDDFFRGVGFRLHRV